jgi:hypothetical protein
MPWEIASGPEKVSSPGGSAWVWRVTGEDGEGERDVEVVVSDLARDTGHGRGAWNSRGRLPVEDVLGWEEPPDRIRCTLLGYVCEGGKK